MVDIARILTNKDTDRITERQFLNNFVKVNVYAGTLIKIANGDRMDNALKGLPTYEELKAQIEDAFPAFIGADLEYSCNLQAYPNRPVPHYDLQRVLMSYEVSVSYRGEVLCKITKNNMNIRCPFDFGFAYDKDDIITVEYSRANGKTHKAKWSLKDKKFMTAP